MEIVREVRGNVIVRKTRAGGRGVYYRGDYDEDEGVVYEMTRAGRAHLEGEFDKLERGGE